MYADAQFYWSESLSVAFPSKVLAGRPFIEREELIRQIDDAEFVIVGLERQVAVAENASRIDQVVRKVDSRKPWLIDG